MRFRRLRRRRRQPKTPFYILELDIPLEEIIAELVFPGEAA